MPGARLPASHRHQILSDENVLIETDYEAGVNYTFVQYLRPPAAFRWAVHLHLEVAHSSEMIPRWRATVAAWVRSLTLSFSRT
jgi:hypothetical protein